jgi:16S rRNA (cytidine1402-2'-O)-methyltransferase
MIFYEAPHKVTDTLDDFLAVFGGERRISLCRELTKLHEEVLRTTLEGAVEHFKEKEPRGEFVLVVEGAQPEVTEADPEAALKRVEQLRGEGLSLKDAAAQAAAEFGLKKKQLYDMAIGK